ncbi:tandem-95 repeat protein [Roseovarius faecimaris]|uniref:Tandem-95 repeat protein n=1 Tax=Roseovarius faecimaris TaxID=2494550 RepID=A0A6I6IXP5_9RHOB|nr:Ig-like domain-containing protein [Roseovarius faecimaris]QGX97418.1 tandem-95 repeat protein [Roseovarius faecimaris]
MPPINGTNGDDLINGTPGDDDISGRDGNDTIFGLAGNDDIDAGRGDDEASGGDGDDFITGWDGNDTLYGDAGNDTLRGVKEDDELHGGAGNDELDGGSGSDTLYGDEGDDLLLGISGDDVLDGGAGNDTLEGGSSDDVLNGGTGNDSLDGGSGFDILEGGEGDDTIVGGSGGDTAVFNGSIADFSLSASGTDILVQDQNTADGDEGTDTIRDDVEFLQFNFGDESYTLDLTSQADNAPVALVGEQTTDEDSVLDFVLTVVEFDGDGINAPVVSVTGNNSSGAAGSIAVIGSAILTPGYGGLGQASDFNIQFDPGSGYQYLAAGESVTETVTVVSTDVNGTSFTQTFDIVITGVNDAPVANDDSGAGFQTDEDTAVVTANVLANDTDIDASDVLTVAAFDAVSAGGGIVTSNGDGTFTYDPNGQFESLAQGESTTDTFEYTVSDGNGGEDTATVTIAITGVNDAPEAADDGGPGFVTDEDTAFVTGNVLVNDTDPDNGAVLSVSGLDTTGTLGLVTDNGDGTFSYDPNGQFESLGVGESATDQFSYTVTDQFGATDTAVVTITINGVNDAPDAVNDTATTLPDTAVDINVLGNDSDPDANDSLTITGLIQPEHGTVTELNGIVTYTPDAGFTGVDGFSYTISDGNGGFDTANVSVTVGDPPLGNTPPVAREGFIQATADEGGANILTIDFNTLTVDGNPIISDAEQSIAQLDITFIGLENSGRGTATITETSPGSNVFTINLDEFGVVDGGTSRFLINYTVDDGQPDNNTASSFIILEVTNPDGTPGNNAPVATGATITQAEDEGNIVITLIGAGGLATDPDPGDTLSVTSLVFTDDQGNVLGIDPLEEGGTDLVNGVLTINPLVFGLADTETGTFLVQYTVSDGEDSASGTVTLNLTGTSVNTAPTAQVGNEVRSDPDDVITFDGPPRYEIDLNSLVDDIDQDPLTISLVGIVDSLGNPVTGTISDGVVSIAIADLALAAGVVDDLVITYTVDDGIAAPVTSTVNLEVNGPPPDPTGSVVLDFEDFSADPGFATPIESFGGLILDGTAIALEVDEMVAINPDRVAPGLIAGETTLDDPDEGTAALIQGTLLEFDGTSAPTYAFTTYAPGATWEIGDGPILLNPLQLDSFFGTAFDLQSMSLTALEGEDITVTIVPYRVEDTGGGNYDYVAVGSFDVTVSSGSALELNFNSGVFFDDDGSDGFIFDDPSTAETEFSAFDNVVAVQFITTGETSLVDPEDPGSGLIPENDDPLVIDDFVFDL